MKIQVENIKCGGCANSIKNALMNLGGVDHVEVDINEGTIEVSGADFNEEAIISKLHGMGYPLPGNGGIITTAASYVSCMVGRISD